MNKTTSLGKTLFLSLIIVVTVVTAIISSLSLLKDEAIKTHLEIAKLHANTLSDQVTQTFNNINLLSSNLISVINTQEEFSTLNSRFNKILYNNPFVRSINILDSNRNIIYSSNELNKGLHIKINDFYPKPLFNQSVLRFGLPWIGRDLIDASNVTHMDSIDKKDLSFIPVLKYFELEQKEFYILIAINSEYFVNRYIENLDNSFAYIDLYRIDGFLLFSSDENISPGTLIKKRNLYNESLKSSQSWGIESFKTKEYITSYKLTNVFPLNIAIRIDVEESLKDWEEKTSNISILIISLVLVSAILVVALIFKYHLEKEVELKFQRKQIKEQKKFQTLFEQTIFLAAIMKRNADLTQVNNKGLEYLQEDLKEALTKKFWELSCWEKEQSEYLKQIILNMDLQAEVFQDEITLKNTRGEKRVLELSLIPLNIDGELELVALGLDITQRKQREEELKQAYIVFQNAHDGIMITNKDTNIINVNSAFEKSTGFSIEDVYMKSPNILQSGIHTNEFYSKMWQELNEFGFWEGDLINKKKNGEVFNEYITISAVYDEEENVKNYIGIFSDTTNQKKQEERLKEQEQLLHQQSKMAAMGEMIENIAHQWRQPLSVISTIATGIKFKKELGIYDEKEEFLELEKINESSQYLSETIEDFRDFLRTDKPKSLFNIINTFDKSLKLISSKFKNREINIHKDIENVSLYGIENELVQVFLNVFNNAKDALENKKIENKILLIEVKEDNSIANIKITDNGGGIKEEIIDRIFEPYFTTKHQSQGTGIGLYMSQEIIVKHMNGKIKCYNTQIEYEGKNYFGACFEISIPMKN
ncbi:PAS domain S-box protein [Arcobacter roscoffensis]|uniref:histidine kinase n=1 Tax=Arcobacter roscoffensis TaxID=2961520 RepID=A0ABY5E4H0_9BACT|nr:PAS domain S-box protein [Arcobacter roscoffensis]UTJ06462.1 PAS domain-containing sensor histidine kinase [Arcobacter roscoffensis]